MTIQVKVGALHPLGFLSYPLNFSNRFIRNAFVSMQEPLHTIKAAAGENARLREENATLKLQLREFNEMKAENERYRILFSFSKQLPLFTRAASVISWGADPSMKTLIIDKGSSHGIEKDMIVTTIDGLAGKIMRTWPSYSEMLLINDSSFSVSVRLVESRVEGILTGNGRDCRLNYVSNEVEAKEGDTLITSGLDKFFPPGIPVGKVKAAWKTAPELFQSIIVSPMVDTSRLEEVAIIRR
ncbi:MAG: rod shape-determining protein MreC [bacterium]